MKQSSMQLLSWPAFIAAVAERLDRAPEELAADARLIESLACDDFALVAIALLLEELAGAPRTGSIEWEELTVYSLYRFYVRERMNAMLSGTRVTPHRARR